MEIDLVQTQLNQAKIDLEMKRIQVAMLKQDTLGLFMQMTTYDSESAR